jgi:RNA polymerase primary sigma factor
LYDALLEEFDDDTVARQPDDEEGFAAQAVVEMELEQGDDLEVVEQPGEVEAPVKLEEEDLLSDLASDTESWSDDPVRMYLTQMGEIPLLTRAQEIFLAKKIEITRRRFRTKLLECDYVIQQAFKVLKRVHEGELPFDRTVQVSVTDKLEKDQILGRCRTTCGVWRCSSSGTARTTSPPCAVQATRPSGRWPGLVSPAAAANVCAWWKNWGSARSGSSR